MSRLDDSLAGFQHSPKVAGAYDSLVDMLPLKDGAKESVKESGHTVGNVLMVGVRKVAAATEGAFGGAVEAVKEPLREPGEEPAEQVSPSAATERSAFLDELERLDRLHREGGLTDEEFQAAKSKLLEL